MRWVSCDYFNFSSITLYGLLQGWWGEPEGRFWCESASVVRAKGTVEQLSPSSVKFTLQPLGRRSPQPR